MFIFAFPRMRTLKIVCAAFAAVTLGLASPAQDGRTNTAGQAGFRINVIVVPVVAPPRHHKHRDRDWGQDNEAVTYNLGPQQDKLSVTEEVRPMLVSVDNSVARQEQVRIITVVEK